jgi:hypothetical protein
MNPTWNNAKSPARCGSMAAGSLDGEPGGRKMGRDLEHRNNLTVNWNPRQGL